MRYPLILSSLLVAMNCQAAWTLDPAQSTLRFVSVKNEVVAETHRLSNITGQWAADGKVAVTIPVATLDTMIPIRNERMLQYLFAQPQFPTITATTTIKPADIDKLSVGSTQIIKTDLQVTIKDISQTLSAEIAVSKTSDKHLVVHTVSPVLVNALNFKLDTGINQLKDIAKLQRIDLIVPVTFQVTLQKQ